MMIRRINKPNMRYMNDRGSTMIETVISFVVLMIVLAALYSMVRFSSELRMRAVDSSTVQNNFNEQIYRSDGNMTNVDTYRYIGKHRSDEEGNDDSATAFTLRLNTNKTDVAKSFNDPNLTSEVFKTYDSIKLPNMNAVGYVSVDPLVDSENVIAPRVLSFKHHYSSDNGEISN